MPITASSFSAATSQPGLVLSVGKEGSWDEAGVGHPVVRYYLGDNEQRWFLWFTGRSSTCHDIDDIFPSSGSIGVAVSSDGVHWSRGDGNIVGARGEARASDVGRVLSPNSDWWWHDTCHMHVSDVQILSNSSVATGVGVYWCFYSGGNFEEAAVPEGMLSVDTDGAPGGDQSYPSTMEGVRLRPGLAMSQDGRNFARIEGDHHTGALFDVGEDGEWDSLFIGAPQVVAAGPRDMRMYYHSYDAARKKYVVGLATSPDGFKWTKQGPIFHGGAADSDFDGLGVTGRCVVKDIDTKKYFMFYEGVAADGRRSIGVAVSDDGIGGWKRHSEPILEASNESGAWDCGSVGTPWAVSMAQGRWRLYYSGRAEPTNGAWRGIGLALSEADGRTGSNGAPVVFKRRGC